MFQIPKTDSKLNKGAVQNSNTNKSNTNFVSNRKKQNNHNSLKKNKTSFNTSNSEVVANKSKTNQTRLTENKYL